MVAHMSSKSLCKNTFFLLISHTWQPSQMEAGEATHKPFMACMRLLKRDVEKTNNARAIGILSKLELNDVPSMITISCELCSHQCVWCRMSPLPSVLAFCVCFCLLNAMSVTISYVPQG